ncbi:MAG: hypothetical protein G8D61_09420 [gamma proteobacterium symbiont of Ctena orbiculata]|nr:hypothetical protein [Candidatus Thiodiazotropha taylori]MBT3058758.1 hypothetical protein [Candidatus Thiodiazotropha sp. (ex Lucina pensylvanica)]MBV2093272.1 hypothetical protein [Candidatus Thiodiazotropha sp. (ex Codakia orbicularis)]PUB72891.1 MAG: hypothetical protein DBP03_15335 [gamma proteobacterium symbiont of Ctena orbiculata]MBT3061866.1 hypothetical protein [Candidatus Thiodiazotropha sp. (ex Lucina pensylvanica)]
MNLSISMIKPGLMAVSTRYPRSFAHHPLQINGNRKLDARAAGYCYLFPGAIFSKDVREFNALPVQTIAV